MLKSIIKTLTLGLFLFSLAGFAQGNASANKTSEAIFAAANKFLASLDDAQRAKVVYGFKDEAQRKRWSNLPTTMVKRGGLRMGDLTKSQQEAVRALLAAALSPRGSQKVQEIVQGDEMLKTNDRGGPGGPGGRAPMFGKDEYYISFLGQPSTTEPWMIQFGGHHLGINITFVNGHTTLAPSHTGAQPALYEFEGKTIRPLGEETDKAFTLLNSLDEAQRKQAILGVQMHDLVLGPGRDGEVIQPEGIKGSALSGKQRELLLELAGEWTGIIPADAAKAKMDDLKKNAADTWFAWSGPIEKGKGYFRIQGPTVVIEYAPQRLGGDVTKHIHTIYREPKNDYGATWLDR